MEKLILALLMTFSILAGDIDDVFGGGDDDFRFERFSDEAILLEIDREAAIACENGLCTLHSVENRYGEFEVSFNVGEGNPFAGGNRSDGVQIYTGGYGDCNFCDNQMYWGFQVKYTKGKCTQTVKVPKSVYYAVNRYMYGLLTDEGDTRRGFTPADEAMIMFYTTIMNNIQGCKN